MAVVELDRVVKEYTRAQRCVRALDGVTLGFEAGEFAAIVGPSGAGKSTLLHLVGALDTPTSGRVSIDGQDLGRLGDDALTALRRTRLGFVFQFFNLLPALSAWENVALPRLLDGVPLKRTKGRALELLEQVGLAARADHRPAELSGGELQRVAVARALVGDPVLVLADEPTGNLDSAAGAHVIKCLRHSVVEQGKSLVLVTHDRAVADAADRVVTLVDGQVASDQRVEPRR